MQWKPISSTMAPIPLEIKMEKDDEDPDPSNESEGTFERTAQQASVGQSQLQVKLTRLPASVLQEYNKDATGNTCSDGDTDLRTVLGLHTELDIKFEPGEDLKEEPLDPMDHDGAVDDNGDLLPTSEHILVTNVKHINDHEDYSRPTKKQRKEKSKKTNTKNQNNLGLQSKKIYTTRARMKNEKENETKKIIDSKKGAPAKSDVSAKTANNADGLLPPSQTISETTEKQMHDREDYSKLSKKKAKGINKKTNTKNKEGLQSETLNTTRARKKNKNRINIDSKNNGVSEKENTNHADGLLPPSQTISETTEKQMHDRENYSKLSKKKAKGINKKTNTKNEEGLQSENLNTTRARKKNENKINSDSKNNGVSEKENSKHADGLLPANKYISKNPNISSETHQVVEPICIDDDLSRSSKNRTESEKTVLEDQNKEVTVNNTEKEAITYSNSGSANNFSCVKCNFLTEREYILNNHIQAHLASKTYNCDMCSYITVNNYVFIRHIKRHADKKTYVCNVCNKKFGALNSLNCHFITHQTEKLLSDKNDNISNEKKNTMYKTKVVYNEITNSKNLYDDNVCVSNKTLDKRRKIFTLSSSELLIPTKYICTECKFTTNAANLLKSHIEAHSATKKYICDLCSYITKDKQQLHRHFRYHNGEKSKIHNCEICNKKFSERPKLTEHVRTHTGEKPYACKLCDKKYGHSYSLTLHMKTHTGEDKYTCKICDKKFLSTSAFNKHVRIHTGDKPYSCKLCSKKFIRNDTLNSHIRLIHKGEKPYGCEICSKKFGQPCSLRNHMRTHTGEKPYSCKFCDKKFRETSTLHSHLKLHTGEKPHACKLCGRKFVTSSTLTNHLKTHTGEKPYDCKICGRKFARTITLKNHMVIHTGGKPFACNICDKTYRRKSTLKAHVSTHK